MVLCKQGSLQYGKVVLEYDSYADIEIRVHKREDLVGYEYYQMNHDVLRPHIVRVQYPSDSNRYC